MELTIIADALRHVVYLAPLVLFALGVIGGAAVAGSDDR